MESLFYSNVRQDAMQLLGRAVGGDSADWSKRRKDREAKRTDGLSHLDAEGRERLGNETGRMDFDSIAFFSEGQLGDQQQETCHIHEGYTCLDQMLLRLGHERQGG
jgi:hypothetical protein